MKHERLSKTRGGSFGADPHHPAPSPTLGLRLRVWLHSARLDRQLAEGLLPGAFDDRALRAAQLAGMRTRRGIAHSLRRLVEEAEMPVRALLSSAVPVCRRSVLPCREALLGLADRLEQPVPVDPCGVARTLVVLTDGAGPFYDARAARSMSDAVWWIADGLQP
jgi:hypothetical protein